uniref:Uncharacterized protein n=1 Tax=Meloidogyne incognita TaxID=6306 RepID=A0A914NUZ2_MELIC
MSEESIVNNKENGVEAEDKAEENVLEPALYNYVLTEEQKQRKIKCVTWDDKVVEVNLNKFFLFKIKKFLVPFHYTP